MDHVVCYILLRAVHGAIDSFRYLLTAGADGDVRVYKSLSDDEVSFKVGNCVTALSAKVSNDLSYYIIYYLLL